MKKKKTFWLHWRVTIKIHNRNKKLFCIYQRLHLQYTSFIDLNLRIFWVELSELKWMWDTYVGHSCALWSTFNFQYDVSYFTSCDLFIWFQKILLNYGNFNCCYLIPETNIILVLEHMRFIDCELRFDVSPTKSTP